MENHCKDYILVKPHCYFPRCFGENQKPDISSESMALPRHLEGIKPQYFSVEICPRDVVTKCHFEIFLILLCLHTDEKILLRLHTDDS